MTAINKIELFSSKKCPPCAWTKAQFEKYGTRYVDIDADDNPEEFERAIQKTGLLTKPQLLVYKTVDGKEEVHAVGNFAPATIVRIAQYMF